MKLKRFAIYSVLLAVIIAIVICAFLFYFKKAKTKNLQVEQEVLEVEKKKENDIVYVIHKEENLERELLQVKAELAKTIESSRPSYKGEDYTHIMLVLSVIEAKLYRGGNIKNEIVRLKNLSLHNPDLLPIFKSFEDISTLSSRKELKEQYENYVKIAKSELLSGQTSKLEKVMGFISKYFTILSRSKEEDKILIEIGERLNNDDFTAAYEGLNTLDIKSPEAQPFKDNLKKSSLLQSGINDIYFLISSKLGEGERLTK